MIITISIIIITFIIIIIISGSGSGSGSSSSRSSSRSSSSSSSSSTNSSIILGILMIMIIIIRSIGITIRMIFSTPCSIVIFLLHYYFIISCHIISYHTKSYCIILIFWNYPPPRMPVTTRINYSIFNRESRTNQNLHL